MKSNQMRRITAILLTVVMLMMCSGTNYITSIAEEDVIVESVPVVEISEPEVSDESDIPAEPVIEDAELQPAPLLNAADDGETKIVGAWADRAVENRATKLHVTTSLDAQYLCMYDLKDKLLASWDAKTSDIDANEFNKEWHVDHTFEWGGPYLLRYRASADGRTMCDPYDAEVVQVDRPAIIDSWYSRCVEKEPMEITIITNLDMTSVSMYLGENCLDTWREGDSDVKVTRYESYKEWNVTHVFEDPGYYDLWYTATAAGEENFAYSHGVTVKRPAIIDGWYNHAVEMQETEITIVTSLEMTQVKINLGENTLATWNESDPNVEIKTFENCKEWHVTYVFEDPGYYDLWYQASAEGEENLPLGKGVTIARPAVIDVWFDSMELKAGVPLEMTIITNLDMKHVYMNLGEDCLRSWKYTDRDIRVEDHASWREWHITYTFPQDGEYDLWYQASADGVKMENAYSEGMIVIGEGGTPTPYTDDFIYRVNEAGTGIIIEKYTGSDAQVVVEATYDGLPVVEIGDGAFEGNTVITSISLPDTVEVIGVRAFANCTNLREMN